MNKLKRISIMSMLLLMFVLVGCSSDDTLSITTMTGETIEVSKDGLSDEQIAALESISDGSGNIMEIMRSGIFTSEQLEELGFEMPRQESGQSQEQGQGQGQEQGQGQGQEQGEEQRGGQMPMELNMDDLNLDGLSDEQIEAIQSVVDGDMMMEELIESGLFTQEEIEAVGFIAGHGMMGGDRQEKPQGGNGN